MKKTNLIILTSVILLSSLSLSAQDDSKKNKGIRAGWQLSNYYSDGTGIATELNSFYVGFAGEKKIIPLLHFGSGIEYFQNGYTGTTLISKEDLSFKSHVISVPIFLKLKLGPVFGLGGIGMNFNVAQKYKIGGDNVDVPDDLKVNVFDAPVFVGLGVRILIVTIEARYHWGLINATQFDKLDYNSQYLQIGAGISF